MSINYFSAGSLATISLNRPEYLNSLTFEMVNEILSILKSIKKDDKIRLVIFKSEDSKAFCAGGDVRKFYDEKFTEKFILRKKFFYNEYRLNYLIKKFPKPIISLVNGICMGGGVGLSVHGAILIVSEEVKFAMPETAIGFFPDVGAGKILSDLDDEIGTYLALTGKRINSADLIALGLAKYCVPYDKFVYLEKILTNAINMEFIESNIKNFVIKPQSKMFPKLNEEISVCFKSNKVEDIISNLEKNGSRWAYEALTSINKMSPTSLKVTLRQIRLAKTMSFEENLLMEYRISQGCMMGHDFYEGVRAVLVDKDHNPKWNPEKLEGVSKKIIRSHFKPLKDGDLKL